MGISDQTRPPNDVAIRGSIASWEDSSRVSSDFQPEQITNMPVSPAEAAREHAALLSSLEKAANDYPKPKEVVFTYGTAGFRTK